jgi:hypothetical protein
MVARHSCEPSGHKKDRRRKESDELADTQVMVDNSPTAKLERDDNIESDDETREIAVLSIDLERMLNEPKE